jgi:alpha-glucosidase
MPRARFVRATALFSCLLAAAAQTPTASSVGWSTTLNGTPTSFRSVFTIPPSADTGADLIANIKDPEAVNAQDACPGYKAAQLQEDAGGLSAVLTLAGKPCNVYGNDVEVLNLKVEYQAQNRLAVNISPAYIVSIFGADVCLIWLICG